MTPAEPTKVLTRMKKEGEGDPLCPVPWEEEEEEKEVSVRTARRFYVGAFCLWESNPLKTSAGHSAAYRGEKNASFFPGKSCRTLVPHPNILKR